MQIQKRCWYEKCHYFFNIYFANTVVWVTQSQQDNCYLRSSFIYFHVSPIPPPLAGDTQPVPPRGLFLGHFGWRVRSHKTTSNSLSQLYSEKRFMSGRKEVGSSGSHFSFSFTRDGKRVVDEEEEGAEVDNGTVKRRRNSCGPERTRQQTEFRVGMKRWKEKCLRTWRWEKYENTKIRRITKTRMLKTSDKR